MKIACVGIAVLDRIYYLDELPGAVGGKFVANQYREVGGGPAATAAVAAAKLGAEVDFIGRLGDDSIAQTIITELESYHVNCEKIKIYKNALSSQSAIFVDKQGERVIANYPSPDLLDDTQWLENIDFRQYDVVLCDVRWHAGAEYCLQQAQKSGVPTVLDADITPQNIEPLVRLSDHAVFSAPGLTKMTSESDLNKALLTAEKVCQRAVYVTQGDQGCDWREQQQTYHEPALKVNVVDTTGAGDVFHGAFAYAIGRGDNAKKAVQFATAVAALKCTAPGGRAGIPSLTEVENFMQQNSK